jgi:hypothetical protein
MCRQDRVNETLITRKGNFDWRGLPDPPVLAFHFVSSRDRIVQLIILIHQSSI